MLSGNVHEVSPEELFNMFFNGAGGVGGRGFQAHFGSTRRPRRAPEENIHGRSEERQVSGFQQILQFLPIILMVLMSFSSFSGNSSAPAFQLSPQGVYQMERKTSVPGISPNIKYFVNPQFDSLFKSASGGINPELRRVEKEVELEYKHFLGLKCGTEKTYKNNRLYQVSIVSIFAIYLINLCSPAFQGRTQDVKPKNYLCLLVKNFSPDLLTKIFDNPLNLAINSINSYKMAQSLFFMICSARVAQ